MMERIDIEEAVGEHVKAVIFTGWRNTTLVLVFSDDTYARITVDFGYDHDWELVNDEELSIANFDAKEAAAPFIEAGVFSQEEFNAMLAEKAATARREREAVEQEERRAYERLKAKYGS